MARRVDVRVFNGVKFRRYPDAETWAEQSYYVPGIADRQRGVRRLHEEIWIANNGPIPEGHVIHHLDHDPLNNDPSNLDAITAEEHRAHHIEELRASGFYQRPEQLAHLERIRSKASEWHRSPEGREWHRQHGKDTWGAREAVACICEQCGKEYSTLTPSGSRFCSNVCKSAWRRKAGLDNVDRTCDRCGNTFTINRYAKTRHCSRSCSRDRAAAGETSRRYWAHAPTVTRVCEHCGENWESKQVSKPGRYCSANCRAKAKYAESSFDLTCKQCGKAFQGRKPDTLCCSRTCAAYYREARKAARLQPDGR